jgi:membrane protein implicated in regulation of membrane protease activity
MEDKAKLIENLVEKVSLCGKSAYELAKLKILDKSLNVFSSLVIHIVVLFLVIFFMIFISLGSALWLGEILGNSFYGFFLVGAVYFILAIVLHFLFRKWFKRLVSNYIIKHELNK